MKRMILAECLGIARRNNTPEKHPEWEHYHHFTFIVQNNQIVEWGTNRRCSPLSFLGYQPYTKMHSEVDAFHKAKGILDKNDCFVIVNVRITKKGKIRQSKPCKCCLSFLKDLNCNKIYHTTNIDNFSMINLSDYEND